MRFYFLFAIIISFLIQPLNVKAATVDDELSIMAAEQREENESKVTVNDEVETFNRDIPPEVNETQSTNETQPTEVNSPTEINQPTESSQPTEINQPTNSAEDKIENLADSVGMPSPIKTYNNFNEAVKATGFIPLYIPKKSGYTMNYIATINGNMIELRYGRRWEPSVTMAVRTYKRAVGEELRDISGVYGVKWKVDMSSGMTIYIARVNDKTNVAAWSTGQYTFAAMTENLSFAAFHSLIVEELVDICNHYFIDFTK